MENTTPSTEVKHLIYDLFILAISFLALIIMVIFMLPSTGETVTEIAFTLDTIFSLIFLYDFLRSLAKASDRHKYFFRGGGWLDLLGSVVVIPIFRLLRIPRMLRICRSLREETMQDVWKTYREHRTENAFWSMLLITLLMVSITSLVIVPIEAQSPNAQIKDSGQAIWWSLVTITTVGYGDHIPVTEIGRILGSILITVGVALGSVLTSYIITNLMMRGYKDERERKKCLTEGVRRLDERFNRLETLIKELKADQEGKQSKGWLKSLIRINQSSSNKRSKKCLYVAPNFRL